MVAGADTECYYDGVTQKLVLAPEYGDDGGKRVGVCANKIAPVAAFRAHWAPNGMARYDLGLLGPIGFGQRCADSGKRQMAYPLSSAMRASRLRMISASSGTVSARAS